MVDNVRELFNTHDVFDQISLIPVSIFVLQAPELEAAVLAEFTAQGHNLLDLPFGVPANPFGAGILAQRTETWPACCFHLVTVCIFGIGQPGGLPQQVGHRPADALSRAPM